MEIIKLDFNHFKLKRGQIKKQSQQNFLVNIFLVLNLPSRVNNIK